MMNCLLLLMLATTALALGMHKHFKELRQRSPSDAQSLALKGIGWGLLIISPVSLAPLSWPVALLYWLGLLALAILGTATLLSALGKRRVGKGNPAKSVRQAPRTLARKQQSAA